MRRNSMWLIVGVLILCATPLVFAGGADEGSDGQAGETPNLEVWWAATSQFSEETMDDPNPYQLRLIEEIGIGYERPSVSWNSGIDYSERLKLRLAAGDPPDIVRLPRNGFSLGELIESGVAADLTDVLPVYAPGIEGSVPDANWSLIRYESPNNDRIHAIPSLRPTVTHGAFIRQDWLDRLGLEMPETADDYLEVLRAFRDEDANGNGDPNDEIGMTGRTPGRWWDNLFTPFGVAMTEGFPTWDYYDGEVQYAGVQPEMREALLYVRQAYSEGLIDPEVLINTGRVWTGKITSDQVGSFYHMPIFILSPRISDLYRDYEEAEWTWLPPFSVEGVEGKWSEGYVQSANTLENVFIHGEEDTVENALTLLEHINTPEVLRRNLEGIEGLHYNIVDGERVPLPITEENAIITWLRAPLVAGTEFYTAVQDLALETFDESFRDRAAKSVREVMSEAQVFSVIGTNLPSSVYDGYPDIESNQLYFTMMAEIMVGEKPIEAFDEFVERWYATGGTEVTERVQQAVADLGL